MTIRAPILVVVGSLFCGCESSGRDTVAVESNDLGITQLEIRRDRDADERLLTLRGLDRDGAVIATAMLRTGTVLYGADMPAAPHAGTELTVAIGESTASFVSPDRVPHVIYEPLSRSTATFVKLRAVATELDREAGIGFAPPKIGGGAELAYTAMACEGGRFPKNIGGAGQCCQDDSNTYHVNPTTNAVVNRYTYAPAWPSIPVCRKSDGTIGCTGPACLYGPCGSAVGPIKGTAGHIFYPTSNPNVCGWDSGGSGGLGVDYSPEHYTTQTLYGGVTATCGCTGCQTDGQAICPATYTYVKASNTNTQDHFAGGLAISDDGNTMAVGAYKEDSNGTGINPASQSDNSKTDSGALYVYVHSGTTWTQQAYIKASNTDAGDEFGVSVSLSSDGNTMAVGARFEGSVATGINGNESDNSQAGMGAVYVFTRSGTTWIQEAYVKPSRTQSRFSRFGSSVSLSNDGNTLAVGGPNEDSNASGINGDQDNWNAANSGAVYVFTRSGSTWSQQAYVKASNTGNTDWFGQAVALSNDGNTMAVTAHLEDSAATGVGGNQGDNSATDSGAAYVFTRSGTVWSQQAYVKASNTGTGDKFGGPGADDPSTFMALSGDGNTLAVGAEGEDSNATGIGGNQGDNSKSDSGAAYVYTRSGTVWSHQAYIKASNTGTGYNFGTALTLSNDGSLLLIGSELESRGSSGINGDQTECCESTKGSAYRFIRFGTTWNQDRYIKASIADSIADMFGHSVAMSSDGTRLVVGAWLESSNATGIGGNQSDNSMTYSGAAYVID